MNNAIAIIGTVGVPANYGGFETLVENIIEDSENEYTVYCSKLAYRTKIKRYKNANLVYIPLKANGVQSIIYDAFSIFHAIWTGHKRILLLGTSGALALKISKLISSDICFFTNIDGLEWKREKWSSFAKTTLKFFEKICVNNSKYVICDNKEINSYVYREYGVHGRLIAYGGEHALKKTNDSNNTEANFSIQDYYLSICRIEPENNIHLILESFSKTSENLLFIGNWDRSAYGQALKTKFSSFNNIILLNPIYEINALFRIRNNCKAYVHGHSAGGTNPSLVEMMHFSKPIIAFDCNYNRSTLNNQGLFFKNEVVLNEYIDNKKYLEIDTKKIKEIAQEHYTWDIIRDKYRFIFKKEEIKK